MRTSLKKNSKKIEPLLPLITVFLLSVGAPTHTQEIALSIRQTRNQLFVSAYLRDAPLEDVTISLDDGLEAEIYFQLRLYERSQGLFAFLGDKLIVERQPYYRARRDFFNGRYILVTHTGEELFFDTQQAFFEEFMKIEAYELASFGPQEGKRYYLRARIRLNHVKLVPPLNIIYLFYSTGIATDWLEVAAEQISGGRS
ncbi:hypothetical protein ES705_27007 [subsurface metagenome]